MTKKILGLDLGTNSIGWALVGQDFENKQGQILGMGSRIIPMDQGILGEFDKGNSISQTADRTAMRSARRLRERHLLRRERLHRVLNILGFLPSHYSDQIDFTERFGKFKENCEPKIAYNKHEFIFKNSFNRMLDDFRAKQPELVQNGKLIPYDWTLYFLRKEALIRPLLKEEIAWIILNFNQKRGYYQLRGEEEEENPNKLVEFHSLKIVDIITDGEKNSKGEIWYSLILENGWVYKRTSNAPLNDWKDKVRDFIVTTDLNDDGTIKKDKDGREKRSFRSPGDDDWTLRKKKTEKEIDESHKTVGAYIYDNLQKNPSQKIRGKLVRTIERKYYKQELVQILKKQIELQPELFTPELLNDCIRELYRNNEAHRQVLNSRDFVHFLVEDIIFYQRPLKSQKSTISNCPLEFRIYESEDENGNKIKKRKYLKVIPKSHPLYQEFRLWQWIDNLRIYGKQNEDDLTLKFLKTNEDKSSLFDFLSARKSIKQDALIKYLIGKTGLKGKALSTEVEKYRWNYVEDKEYPCNETEVQISTRLKKVQNISEAFLTKETGNKLWQIIYSVNDKTQYEKALKTFAQKNQLDEDSFVENFKRFPPFKNEYGAFSEKAIKKLLPLMRAGKYWDWDKVDSKTMERIGKIITGEFDAEIKDRVREKAIHLKETPEFQGLPLWLAQYIVYGRHSEAELVEKWNSVDDLENYLKEFKQHSLRNPIVEQVVTEALRVVRDVWKKFGNGEKDFFSEIHIELGREMKIPSEERKRMTSLITENENTNLRIKSFLEELLSSGQVENVRPYSPTQQDILKIYEDGVLNSGIEIPEDIQKISKTAQPSKSEFQRYKLWLEQKYMSPYTGQIIPLNKLFTPAYEIEHVIPQSRYFDDSFSNKVICEAAVNKEKDRQLGLEFIKNSHGKIIETGLGQKVKILSEDDYRSFVDEHYKNNRSKRYKLLLEDIPEKMIERQINDTRYISKFISNVLSNIVRSDTNDEGVNSKNIIPGNGKITSLLKRDWGLEDVWNDLILPRFERMNRLANTTAFTSWNENHKKFLPAIPLELSKGFQKKRIDHRHHAMDALVIACATRDHVNLLNNQSARSEKSRYDLQYKLRRKQSYFNERTQQQKDAFKEFYKPWNTFTQDARNELKKIVVSIKQNLRVINKSSNKYEKYIEKNGKKSKEMVPQIKGDNWAIRKPMHKDTVSGEIKLRRMKKVSLGVALNSTLDIVNRGFKKYILDLTSKGYDKSKLIKYFKEQKNQWKGDDISKVEIYYWDNENVASRVNLDTSFNEEKIINSVTDTGIQKILLTHLARYHGMKDEKGKEIAPETIAFTPEGIEEMNKNFISLNNGKFHQPIFKVRTYEPKGNKFAVGVRGNKPSKFVEAAKGTNLFFAIYQDSEGKRSYETIPLNIVIERQKHGLNSVPEENENGERLLFCLSPNDLVYVPKEGEELMTGSLEPMNIYKMVSASGPQCFFVHQYVANSIINKVEFSALNKMERSIDGIMIKELCQKIKVDRLGYIL